MSELLRKAVEKARILRAKPHLNPPASTGVNPVGQHRTAQFLRKWLRDANPEQADRWPELPIIEDNGQLRLLTSRRLGMIHEFKSYNKTGQEERSDFLKAGIIGTGLAAAGGLAGLGLYKAGVSGAAKKAESFLRDNDRLKKAITGIRDWKLGKVAADKQAQAATMAAAKKSTASHVVSGIDAQKFRVERLKAAGKNPAAPTAVAPAQTPTAVVPAVVPAQTKAAAQTFKVASKNAPAPAPKVASGKDAADLPVPAPVAKNQSKKLVDRGVITKSEADADALEIASSKSSKSSSDELRAWAAEQRALRAKKTGQRSSRSKEPFIEYNGHKVFTGEDFTKKWGSVEEQKKIIDKTVGSSPVKSASVIPVAKKSKVTSGKKSQKAEEGWDAVATPEEAEWEASYNLMKKNASEAKPVAKKAPAKKVAAVAKAPKPSKPEATVSTKTDAPASKYNTPPLTPQQIREIQKSNRLRKEKRIAKTAAAQAAKKSAKGKKKNLSAMLSRVRYFNQFQTDEAGIPLTGRVARDRFVKKLRDEDLDRRDANILRAGSAGALAGLLARGRIGAGKRALIGAGAGGLGVIGIRALTNNDRDIYGERDRGSKRAELLPAVGGLGAAAWLAGKRLKAFAKKFNHVGHGEHGEHGGVKELGRGFYSAKLLPSERWIKRSDPRGWVQNEVLPAPDKHSAYSKYVADKMRAIRRLNSGNIPYTQRAKKPVEWLSGAQAQLPSYYFSSRLRGLKNFDDYRLYYFKGRNTGIAARSAEEARSKKKRGGDELVAVRTPSDSEKSQMARGVWVRTRRDGKSPQKSRYGKGRGQGPARKSLGAKLRVRFFEKKRFGPPAGFYDKNSPEYWNSPERKAEREVLWQENLRKENAQIPRHLRAQGWSWTGRWDGTKGGGSIYRDQDGNDQYIGKDGFKGFSSRLRAIKFFEKREKRGMNPYVGAALSGFGSGAALGSLALLKRGATFRGAAKTAAKLGLASAGIVGGGALLGSKIVGDPRKEESAPFMKRAAIGGTLVGAGAGLGGALLLRKTKGGARALVAASKKSEPFSRPAMWLRKTPLAGAAAIGGVGGAVYGGGMGADEGQQVDSIRNLRKDMKKFSVGSFQFSGKRLREFSALSDTAKRAAKAVGGWAKRHGTAIGLTGAGVGASVAASRYYGPSNKGWKKLDEQKDFSAKLRLFGRWDQPRDKETKAFRGPIPAWVTGEELVNSDGTPWQASSPQLANAMMREAKRYRTNVQRTGRFTGDVAAVLQGKDRERDASGRIKKREWEKSWFKNKATEIGLGVGGFGVAALARYGHMNPHTAIGRAYRKAGESAHRTGEDFSKITGGLMTAVNNATGARKSFSAKLKRLRELDAIAEYEGWDVRDPRGRSARVFAPGSRRRERRQKEWHEKTENERKLWKAGIAAGVLGGAGTMLVGQRLVSGKSLIPSRFIPKKPNPDVFVDAAKVFKAGA